MNRFQAQAAKSFPQTIQESGEYQLQYHRYLKLFFIITSCFMILMPIALYGLVIYAALFGVNKIVWDMESIGLLLFVFTLFGFMGFAGIWLIYEITKKPICVTPHQISQQTRSKNIEIPWDFIAEVDWSPTNKWFIIHTNSGDKLRVSVFLLGFCYFVVDLCQRVDQSKLEKAIPGITMCNNVLKQINA
jgi:hypothetical protein